MSPPTKLCPPVFDISILEQKNILYPSYASKVSPEPSSPLGWVNAKPSTLRKFEINLRTKQPIGVVSYHIYFPKT